MSAINFQTLCFDETVVLGVVHAVVSLYCYLQYFEKMNCLLVPLLVRIVELRIICVGAQTETYHNVTTSLEYVLVGIDLALASPKSASFSSPTSLMRRFWGFRSRCNTRLL